MLRTLLATLVLVPALAFAAPAKVNIDTQNSTVKWTGSKALIPSKHNGTVNVSGGALMVDGDKITGGSIIIDMTTIKDVDQSPDMQAKLVGHLNSADFFDTAKYKDAKFEITKATPGKNGDYTLDGTLTIHGKSNPATVMAKVTKENKTWTATGKLDFDRTKFDVKYNSQSAFPDIIKAGKDKVIADKVELDFTLKTAAM